MIGRDWCIGMKVVCTQDVPPGGYGDEILPIEGRVYTLRSIDIDEYTGLICVRLVEIVNATRAYTHKVTGRNVVVEPAFPAFRFRPLEERKTDISVFTAMLTGAKEREPA